MKEEDKKGDFEALTAIKMQEFDEEFNKAIIAFKGILYYGTCFPKIYDEIDEDTTGINSLRIYA